MNRSKLSLKAIMLMSGIGLAVAALAGSQPAAAQSYSDDYGCPAGYYTIRALVAPCRITPTSPMITDIRPITGATDLTMRARTAISATASLMAWAAALPMISAAASGMAQALLTPAVAASVAALDMVGAADTARAVR
jgi:hypothetical protein